MSEHQRISLSARFTECVCPVRVGYNQTTFRNLLKYYNVLYFKNIQFNISDNLSEVAQSDTDSMNVVFVCLGLF